MITLATFESTILHILPSDMDPQILCGAAHFITCSAGLVSLPHSAQDSLSATIPILFAGIYVQSGHKLTQMVHTLHVLVAQNKLDILFGMHLKYWKFWLTFKVIPPYNW